MFLYYFLSMHLTPSSLCVTLHYELRHPSITRRATVFQLFLKMHTVF